MKEHISIDIFLKSNDLTGANARRWFESMRYFEPLDMISKKLTNGKVKKFSQKKFDEAIIEEIEQNAHSSIMIMDIIDSTTANSITINKGLINNNIASLSCNLSDDLYEANRDKIMELIDDYMKEYDGIVACACSLEDIFWQDNEDIQMYQIKKRSKRGIHTKRSDMFPDDVIVDTEFNPGHSHIVDGIWFGSCWRMWYGKDYYNYIPKEVLANYKECYENVLLQNDVRRITLYENTWDYGKKENRERQWNFRCSVGVDDLASILENHENTSINTDAAIEILEGDFIHGGSRIIKYYYNKKGKLVAKSQAFEVKIYELGEKGDLLWSESIKI